MEVFKSTEDLGQALIVGKAIKILIDNQWLAIPTINAARAENYSKLVSEGKMATGATSKADIMRRLRAERKDKGLVEFREWLSPEHRAQVKKYVARLRASK